MGSVGRQRGREPRRRAWDRVVAALAVFAGTLTLSTVVVPPPPAKAQISGFCERQGIQVTCTVTRRNDEALTLPDGLVPLSPVTITAAGTAGHSPTGAEGGSGARVTADFVLPAGTTLHLHAPLGVGALAEVSVDGETLMIAAGGGGGGDAGRNPGGSEVAGGRGGDAGLVRSDGSPLSAGAGGPGEDTGVLTGGSGGPTAECCPWGGVRKVIAGPFDPCPTSTPGVDGNYAQGKNGGDPARHPVSGVFSGGGGDGWRGGIGGGTGAHISCDLFGEHDLFSSTSGSGGGAGGLSYVRAPGSPLGAVAGSISSSLRLDRETFSIVTVSFQAFGVDDLGVAFEPVTPDPRSTPVTRVVVTYDRKAQPSITTFRLERVTGEGESEEVPLSSATFVLNPLPLRPEYADLAGTPEEASVPHDFAISMSPFLTAEDGFYVLSYAEGTRFTSETFTVETVPPVLSFEALPAEVTTDVVSRLAWTYDDDELFGRDGDPDVVGTPGWRLTRDGQVVEPAPCDAVCVVHLSSFTFNGDERYTMNFAGLTTAPGRYEFTVVNRDGDGNLLVSDPAGNEPVGEHTVVWEQRDPLLATVGPMDPEFTTDAPPAQIPVTFNRPVTGFEIGDLTLTRTVPGSVTIVPLVGGVRLAGSGASWAVEDIATALEPSNGGEPIEGSYELSISSAGGIVDDAGFGLAADASATFVVDRTGPTGAFHPVLPNPRTTRVDELTLEFSEPVVGFDLGDLEFGRSGSVLDVSAPIADGTITLTTSDDRVFVVGGLSELTDPDGDYDVALFDHGITDRIGHPLFPSPAVFWSTSGPPHARFEPVESPRPDSVDEVTVTFTEPVTGVELADFSLWRGGAQVDLAGVAVVADSDTAYRLTGLADLTAPAAGRQDRYELRLAAGAGVTAADGEPLTPLDDSDDPIAARIGWETWGPPTVTILPFDPALRSDPVAAVGITFSHPVDGFDLDDITLVRNTVPVPLTGTTAALETYSFGRYTLVGLTELTATDGDYSLTIDHPGSGVADVLGSPLDPDFVITPITFTVDATPPQAIIVSPPNPSSFLWNEQVPLVFECTDARSELTGCDLTIDGRPFSGDSGDELPTDRVGSHTIALTATDSFGHTTTTTANYQIIGPNPVANDDHYRIIGAQPLTVTLFEDGVLANDLAATIFPDPGDPLTAVVDEEPTKGELEFNNDNGTFTYTPDPGATGIDTFTYDARDGALFSNTATVVLELNQPVPALPRFPTFDATLDAPDTPVAPGTVALVQGFQFPPSRTVTVVLAPTGGDPVVLGTLQAQTNGAWARNLTVPAATPDGAHRVAAVATTANGNNVVAFDTITVQTPDPTTTTTSTTTTSSTTSTTTSTSTTTTTQPGPGSAAVRLTKTAGQYHDADGNGLDPGDTLEYSFTVTNTGDVALDQVAIDDPLITGLVPCPTGPLAPSAERTCGPGFHTLAESEFATTLTNSATVTATAPGGTTVTDTDRIDTAIPPACTARIAAPDPTTDSSQPTDTIDPVDTVAPDTSAPDDTATPNTTDIPDDTAPPDTTDTPDDTTADTAPPDTTGQPDDTTGPADGNADPPTTTTTTTTEPQVEGFARHTPAVPAALTGPAPAQVDPCDIPPTTTTTAPPAATTPPTTPTTTTASTTTPSATTTTAADPSAPTTAPAAATPTISVAHPSIGPGEQQTATGTGFQPGETVDATQLSTPLPLGTRTVAPDGTFTYTWTIRPDETPGTHTLDVTGSSSGTVTATFTITAPTGPGGGDGGGAGGEGGGAVGGGSPSGSLPATGTDISAATAAAVLIACGLAILAAVRLGRRT